LAGYVNSDAVIPEQTVRDGVVRIEVVEARLGDISATKNGRLQRSYLTGQLGFPNSCVVNVNQIESQQWRRSRASSQPFGSTTPSEVRSQLIEIHVAARKDDPNAGNSGREFAG
jgi:hypothetical protein